MSKTTPSCPNHADSPGSSPAYRQAHKGARLQYAAGNPRVEVDQVLLRGGRGGGRGVGAGLGRRPGGLPGFARQPLACIKSANHPPPSS